MQSNLYNMNVLLLKAYQSIKYMVLFQNSPPMKMIVNSTVMFIEMYYIHHPDKSKFKLFASFFFFFFAKTQRYVLN